MPVPVEKKTITMHDVAREAGVSTKTVSRVINNDGYVSEETRQRVRSTIDHLGYRPNRAARNLASNRSGVIGLMIPDVSNPYFSEVVRGVQNAALKHGYNVLLFNTESKLDREREAYQFLEEHRVDGAIVNLPFLPREELEVMLSRQKAAVVVDSYPIGGGVGNVRVDFYDAAVQAVHHMVRTGRGKIGYISPINAYFTFQERYKGILAGLEAEGIPIRSEYFMELKRTTIEDNYLGAKALLINHPEINGLICFNDMVALGAMKACDEMGIAIPDQMALIGFDDIAFAALSRISLTTMRVPKFDVGVKSVEMLINRINGVTDPAEYILKAELVERSTTRIVGL